MMQTPELDETALDVAEQAIGDGPVVMVNLLRFHATPNYPASFGDAKPDSLSGYYEGYVGGFRETCEAVGVVPELLHAGPRVHSLLGTRSLWCATTASPISGRSWRAKLTRSVPSRTASPWLPTGAS